MTDDFLDRLTGSWNLTGTMGSNELRQRVQAGWVLQGRFLRMHFIQDAASPERPPYEADYMIGRDDTTGEYVLHLFDTFGAGYSRTVGVGTRRGSSVEFLFEYPDALFSNEFTWDEAKGRWEMLLRRRDEAGAWTVFAEKTPARA